MSLTSIMMNYVTKTEDSFICSVTVESSEGKKVTMLGTGKDVDTAMQAAINNSQIQMATISSGNTPQTTYYPSQSSNNQPINNTMENKSKLNGGGSKPASDKQKQIVENIANKQSQSGDQLCRNLFNEDLNGITGAEANRVIQNQKNSMEF